MRIALTLLGSLAALDLVAGCSSGQSDTQPGVTPVNAAAYKAQLAVGVATFADGSKGLSAVATFRQPNGLSGTLVNTPTITGPVGFKVPSVSSAGSDAGTNHISASPQVPPLSTPAATTFGETVGLFAYGFAPDNSDATGTPYFNFTAGAYYGSPALTGMTMAGTAVTFEGGPPAYPQTQNGTYPPGFTGFTQGFTTFAAAPVVGIYTLKIVIPEASAANTTSVTATPGTLTSIAGLGAITAAPVFSEDGAGGGTATCTVPATAKETIVDATDVGAGTYYTVVVPHGGAISATFPSNLGIYASGAPTATFTSGDEISISCIATNYPAFEAGPPANTQQLPTITGSNGQADISFSPNFDGTY
jgi:hypothetical protein